MIKKTENYNMEEKANSADAPASNNSAEKSINKKSANSLKENSTASVSINFSNDGLKIPGNLVVPNSLEVNKSVTAKSRFAFLQNSKQRNYALAGGVVFVIIVFHFIFQISFIQSENFKMLQNLTKTEQFEKSEPIAENTFVPEIREADKTKEKAKNIIKRKISKPEITRNAKNINPQPVKIPSKTAPRMVIKKKEIPQETKAERLRRVEKILTGV